MYLFQASKIEIWNRTLSNGLVAAFINLSDNGAPTMISCKLSELGIEKKTASFSITEVFENKHIGHFVSTETFSVRVNPSGVFFIYIKEVKEPHLNVV